MNTLIFSFMAVSMNLDLPKDLLASVCFVESKHKPGVIHKADGNSDSLGVCQIKLATAKQFGFKGTSGELQRNNTMNVFYAGKYLQYQLKRYHGDIVRAVSAYNSGTYREGHVSAMYVNKVYLAWSKSPW